ncbi:MAG: hypothetical protein K1X74_22755 [Pirellulales bacterium]|nr:hypothetical protein [Pirellulales bacterium]
MNSIARVLGALHFGRGGFAPPDRVPVFPVPLMQGALVYGCTVEEYFAMPAEKIARAQVELNRMLDGVPDAVAGFPHVIEDVTGWGLTLVHHYRNSTPATGGMLIREFTELSGLRAPRPEASAQLAKTRDVIGALRGMIGGEKVVLGACIAPFSLPSMLMGTSKWMRLLFTAELRKRYLQPLLEVCQQFVVEWARLQLQAGAHVVVLADGMASATMLPRAMFEDFARPLVRDTIRQIGGMVAYEPVGRIEPFVDACADLGAVALLIGEEDDVATCKRKLGGRLGLVGNVNNMKMRRWSPARIELVAKRALRAGMPGYGFILGNQGPEIPFDVSLDQIAALVQTVEKYGRYETSPAARGLVNAGSDDSRTLAAVY